MTSAPDLPGGVNTAEGGADGRPERGAGALPSREGDDRPAGVRPDLSARDLQENRSQGEPLEARPGSDADQANEVPHVG